MEQALRADVNNRTASDAFVYRDASDLIYITGPSARMGRITSAVVGSGSRLPFDSPSSHQNTSYETQNFLPSLKCDTADSTVIEDVVKSVDGDLFSGVTNIQNRTADSLNWNGDQYRGEIGYLGLIYPRGLGYPNPSLTWNNNQSASTNHYVFAIQRRPTDLEHLSDTEYLSCVLWNASVSYTVKTRNGIVGIEDIHQDFVNEFDPRYAIVDTCRELPCSGGLGSPAYSGYSLALSSYLLGYVAWRQDDARSRYLSAGPIGTTALSTGEQFYNMTRNMNEASKTIGNIQSPSNVRNITFREDIEAFALNVSLSILNDASLWSVTSLKICQKLTL